MTNPIIAPSSRLLLPISQFRQGAKIARRKGPPWHWEWAPSSNHFFHLWCFLPLLIAFEINKYVFFKSSNSHGLSPDNRYLKCIQTHLFRIYRILLDRSASCYLKPQSELIPRVRFFFFFFFFLLIRATHSEGNGKFSRKWKPTNLLLNHKRSFTPFIQYHYNVIIQSIPGGWSPITNIKGVKQKHMD